MSTGSASPTLAQSAAASVRHPLSVTLLGLTVITGVVDAVSYLGLGHVFTANMTGNVVLLGFGLAGAKGLPVISPLVSLAAFLVGSGVGGRLASTLAGRPPVHVGVALAIEVVMIAVAAGVAAAVKPHPSTLAGDVVVALLAFPMGVRNATARKLAVPDLTTTVLTMTLTGLAADSPLAGGSWKGTTRRVSAVLAMLLGALAGALMVKTSLALPLGCAAGLGLIAWLGYVPRAQRAST